MTDKLTELVLEYQSLDDSSSYKKQIFNKIYLELYKNPMIQNTIKGYINRYFHNEYLDTYDVIFRVVFKEKILQKYNPLKYKNFMSCFFGFAKNSLKYQSSDIIEDLTDIQEDDEGNSHNPLEDIIVEHEDIEETVIVKNMLDIFIQKINYTLIHFLEHKGKAFNSTKLTYWKIFYTSDIVKYSKDNDIAKYIHDLNQQQIFSSIELNLLDMAMLKECRTTVDITYCPLNTYEEIFEDTSNIPSKKLNKEIKIPFEARIFIEYIKKYYNKEITNSNICLQQGTYNSFIKSLKQSLL